MAGPRITDVVIPTPPPRVEDPQADFDYLVKFLEGSQTGAGVNAKLERQHRAVLLTMLEVNVEATQLRTINPAAFTVSDPPTQAEVQAIAAQLVALVTAFNIAVGTLFEVQAGMRQLIQSATTNLKAVVPE